MNCTGRVFSTGDISVVDINELIDIGLRFDVSNTHYNTRVRDYLKDGKDTSGTAIFTRDCTVD